MDRVWYFLDGGLKPNDLYTPESIILSLLMAFVLGQVLAWVYYGTHNGLSYSKSFVQALIPITVVIAMVMAVIGNSIVTAFGLIGSLAIIRFRNMVKDTRDMAFIFCALVIGMASGSQRYSVAIAGTILLCSIMIYLHVTSFGSNHPQNAFLRFELNIENQDTSALARTLKKFCTSYMLISSNCSTLTSTTEYAYQLRVQNARHNPLFIEALEQVKGIQNISLSMQEELLEV